MIRMQKSSVFSGFFRESPGYNSAMTVTEFRLKMYPKDFAKVRAFYEIALGLPVIRDWDTARSKGVMFQVAGTVLELLSPPATGHMPVAGADVSWEVADVRALWDEMKSTQPI